MEKNQPITSQLDALSETGSAPARSAAHRFVWFRLMASGVLLWFLLRKISLGEVAHSFGQMRGNWPYLLAAVLMPGIGIVLGSFRLKCLLAAQSVRIPFADLCKANLIGGFYNQLLPSTIGGDIARSLWISKLEYIRAGAPSSLNPTITSFTIIGVDRVIGSFGILTVGLLAAAFSPSVIGEAPQLAATLPFVAAGAASAMILPFLPVRVIGRKFFSIPFLQKLRGKGALIYRALRAYGTSKRYLLAALFLSAGVQSCIILLYWILASALGIGITLRSLMVLIPVVTLISMTPITIDGIGLRENALSFLGASFGLTLASSVALAWSFLAMKLCWAVVGGFIQFWSRPARPQSRR